MFRKYAATAFEVEAERRREVIAEAMRGARQHTRTGAGESLESERWTTPTGRGPAWLAATLVSQIGLRA